MAKKESKIKNTKTNLKTNTKNKLTRNGNIYFIIIIVLLIALIFITGFRTEGFLTKVLSLDSSSRNVKSASCVYADLTNLKSSDSLVLGCEYDKSIGYFCDEDLKLKSKTYTLKRDTCKTLNTCFDGIKNQNETQIDCGGVCAPCNSGSGSSCEDDSDCDDGNPCTSDVCVSGVCENNSVVNGTFCGNDKVCELGQCYDIDSTSFGCDYNPRCGGNNCYLVPDLENMFVCSDDDAPAGWEFTSTHIGEQMILSYPGNDYIDPTTVLINGTPIQDGDLVGVFYKNEDGLEICEGFRKWVSVPDVGYNTLFISAYVPILSEWGGIEEVGTELIWKVFDRSEKKVYTMTPTYYSIEEMDFLVPGQYNQESIFMPDSLSVLKKLEVAQECSINGDCSDGNPCTIDLCDSGVCAYENVINGESCGAGNVCMNGDCVEEPECVKNSQCNDENPCTIDSCVLGECVFNNLMNGTGCGNNMVCQSGTCVELLAPECTNNSQCNDNNPCTNDVCSSGECVNTNKTNGSSCGEGMVCQSGTCVEETIGFECTNNSQCHDGNPCTIDNCVLGECVNTIKTNGSNCGGGKTCENGICLPPAGYTCTKDSQCNDGNPCTSYSCVSGECVINNKPNLTSCSGNKVCQNGACVGCQSNSECVSNSFCHDEYCDLQTKRCVQTPINEGEFCGDSIHEYLTCSSGSCVFDSINLGLCNEPLVDTGTIAGYYLPASVNDNLLSVGQKLLGFASKYVSSDGELKCAGTNLFYDPEDPINPDLAPAGFPYSVFGAPGSSPKVAYGYGEVFNDFIRTTDYVCRVKATYEISSEFPTSNKWYPMGLSKVVQFKDYTTGSTTIDFTNTDNCTYVGN